MGHLKLDRGMISTKATIYKFLLADVAYPLDGMITMNMKCIVDERADEQNNKRRVIYRNFLSVYQVVDGYGAWPRFWCVLEKAMLRFYRNPEDEGKKVLMALNVKIILGTHFHFPNIVSYVVRLWD